MPHTPRIRDMVFVFLGFLLMLTMLLSANVCDASPSRRGRGPDFGNHYHSHRGINRMRHNHKANKGPPTGTSDMPATATTTITTHILKFQTETRQALVEAETGHTLPSTVMEQHVIQDIIQPVSKDIPPDSPALKSKHVLGRDETAADPAGSTSVTHSTVADTSIWVFLASIGFFTTGLIWSLYVRVGVPRLDHLERTRQDAARAMHDRRDVELSDVLPVPPPVYKSGASMRSGAGLPSAARKREKKTGAGSWLKTAFRE